MAKNATKMLPIRLDDEHVSMLDALRSMERDCPNRTEMFRRLLERASAAARPRRAPAATVDPFAVAS